MKILNQNKKEQGDWEGKIIRLYSRALGTIANPDALSGRFSEELGKIREELLSFISTQIQKAHQDGYTKGRMRCLEQHYGKELEETLAGKIKEIEEFIERKKEDISLNKGTWMNEMEKFYEGMEFVVKDLEQLLSILKEK